MELIGIHARILSLVDTLLSFPCCVMTAISTPPTHLLYTTMYVEATAQSPKNDFFLKFMQQGP
jgi:hypothetical protein